MKESREGVESGEAKKVKNIGTRQKENAEILTELRKKNCNEFDVRNYTALHEQV